MHKVSMLSDTTSSQRNTITPFGAQLLSWNLNDGHPVIWLSPQALTDGTAPIRGGIPLCFPWFGSARTSSADVHSPEQAPDHGFARTQEWKVLNEITDDDATYIVLQLHHHRDDSDGYFPHELLATLTVSADDVLALQLEITNKDDHPFTFEEAFHSYFAVGDVKDVTIEGLNGARYLDKARGNKWRTQRGDLSLVGPTDSIYSSQSNLTLSDPRWIRRISVETQGSHSTIVWNPWVTGASRISDMAPQDWQDFVCVEIGNVGEHAVRLEPGQSHSLELLVRVDMLI